MKIMTFLFAASILLASCATQNKSLFVVDRACNDKSAIEFSKKFYRDHYLFFSQVKPALIDELYTTEFAEIITNHAECVGDNGVCNIDFDPWLYAQDGYVDGDISYSSHPLDNFSLNVDLDYQFRIHPTHPAKQQKVSLNLVKAASPVCWKLDDMILPDGSSIKKMMQEDYQHFYFINKTKLSWRLISSGIFTSTIAVNRDNKLIAHYELHCDVSERLHPDHEQLDGEMNRADLVVTPFQPQGLLITSCRVGAHSKQLAVYDLASTSLEPVWMKTGSYFSEWTTNENKELVLFYDEPCIRGSCAAAFRRVDVLWKERLEQIVH